MKVSTAANLVRAVSIILILAGAGVLGVVAPKMPGGLKAVYSVVALLLMVMGYTIYSKTSKYLRRAASRSGRRALRGALIALLLAGVAAQPLVGLVAHAQTSNQPYCDTEVCPSLMHATYLIEYLIIGLLPVVAFLSLGGLIFARTAVGPLFSEIQYLSGIALIILVFAALLLYPLHVIFVPCNVGGGGGGGGGGGWFSTTTTGTGVQGCYINICNIKSNGPPLLRFFANLMPNALFQCP